ncbi:uncharacterized protein LOC109850308 [Asparagus officinalis]|uniref:uncharacterized protein LOC109850308 n=1 Tax=Asparagus officinalis TaxID=4686 RepID=UPI00098E7BDE|nr:uncharacterized protein LOC109850308 [Asparagus officinalis]XP_020275879.1 uncharacterized protein LOC109850308 [Asparagus officinalis]XP_020275880.1 uncharacterized protein LOC109850308 [Asparagus officinalis]
MAQAKNSSFDSLEVTHIDSQLETQSSSKKNLFWTREMDSCLSEALVEQIHRGQKCDKSFKNDAYEAVCVHLYAKCGIKINESHVRNRLKTLKKDFSVFQAMLNSNSGFVFNRITKMMDAELQVWEDYINAHPGVKQYRYKAVPCFENLQVIYGNDGITDLASKVVKERRVRRENERGELEAIKERCVRLENERGESEAVKERCVQLENERGESSSINVDRDGDKETDKEEDVECMRLSNSKEQDTNLLSTSKTSPKLTYKRKHETTTNMDEEFQILKSGMDAITYAIWKCGHRALTEEKLFDEVLKVEGLNEDSQLLAYDFLCGDAVRGRTFVGLPIQRRKRWLELKLGWTSHNGVGSARNKKRG